jgi:hypothetical protein
MNSPTITMERKAAVQKLEEYETAVKANPRACIELDRGILVGYRVLARGGRLVDVNDALRNGGLNLAGQPRLALSRAHVAQTRWCPGASIDPHWKSPMGSVRGQERNGGGVYRYCEPTSSWGTRTASSTRGKCGPCPQALSTKTKSSSAKTSLR